MALALTSDTQRTWVAPTQTINALEGGKKNPEEGGNPNQGIELNSIVYALVMHAQGRDAGTLGTAYKRKEDEGV